MIAVCMYCKKPLQDQLENCELDLNRSDGICDACLRKEYPEFAEELLEQEKEKGK